MIFRHPSKRISGILSFRNAVRRDASALKMSSYFCASPKERGRINFPNYASQLQAIFAQSKSRKILK